MELRNLHYFREISAIPRKSFHEEKDCGLSEAFARTHGLWHTRDQLHNVVFKKPGSAGREQEAPLMLQDTHRHECVPRSRGVGMIF